MRKEKERVPEHQSESHARGNVPLPVFSGLLNPLGGRNGHHTESEV